MELEEYPKCLDSIENLGESFDTRKPLGEAVARYFDTGLAMALANPGKVYRIFPLVDWGIIYNPDKE